LIKKSGVTASFIMMLLLNMCYQCSVAQSDSTNPPVGQSNEAKKQRGGFEKKTITYPNALRDWKRIFAATKGGKPPSNSDAFDLAGKLFPDALLKGSGSDTTGDVCGAGFFRIAGSNGYSLVATYDINGRRFCNDLTVVHRDADGLSAYSAYAWGGEEVEEFVGEVQSDGRVLLVFPVAFSEYEGTNSCMAFWEEIYSFDSGVLVNRDSDHKSYYRKLLHRELSEGLQEAKKDDADRHGDEAVCIQMEADKIRRFLGISPDAGKAAAIRWLSSKNTYMRGKGLAVLMDIGDPSSLVIAQQAALGWLKSKDRIMRADGEMWLEFHGDEEALTIYQDLALQWLQGDDKSLRGEGLDALDSIANEIPLEQDAIKLLQKLADNPSENVANRAKMALNAAEIRSQAKR